MTEAKMWSRPPATTTLPEARFASRTIGPVWTLICWTASVTLANSNEWVGLAVRAYLAFGADYFGRSDHPRSPSTERHLTMHPQKAILIIPARLQPGDKIPLGRGPWARVEGVRKVTGRPPVTGPNVKIITMRGNVIVPAARHIRAIRSK